LNRRRRKTPPVKSSPELAGVCLLVLSFIGFYCVFFPSQSGTLGQIIAKGSLRIFGQAVYPLFALIFYRGCRLLLHRENREPYRYVLVDGLLLASFCSLIASFGILVIGSNYGGLVGKGIHQLLTQMFGKWGALFSSSVLFSGVLLWRSGAKPVQIVNWLSEQLKADWQSWRESMAQQQIKKP